MEKIRIIQFVDVINVIYFNPKKIKKNKHPQATAHCELNATNDECFLSHVAREKE